ncbi:MAG: NADH-quinone oxidoreductase subunit A [Actinomycetota bacterium]|nr:NADH-quinone oxidoreductase subunit A [Actinomycetota bacterium]
MLHQYLPVLVFASLGILVGGAFATLNFVLGPKRLKNPSNSAAIRQSDPYECGLPSEISKTFRFGVSFYLVAMLFILFDIEVVFLYPIASILKETDSVFVLVSTLIFVFPLAVAFIYEWRKGGMDWK